MWSEENFETRQKNELEALQAIYDENLRDCRKKGAWNNWVPLDLSITLTPQEGSMGTTEFYVQVDLRVICNADYPNSEPKLLLENVKGLSSMLLVELKECLDQKAKELRGEEMIFNLCEFVKEFLHKHNKPGTKSFYDEMLQIRKEKEKIERETKQLEMDKKKQSMMEEYQKRQQILLSENKIRRENRYNSEYDTDDDRRSSLDSRKHHNSFTAESSDEYICDHNSTRVIDFGSRNIQRGKCLRHSTSNHITYSGIDIESGELVLISEWNIHFKSKTDIPQIQKQLSGIEQEINYLTKLPKQSFLAQYYAIKHDIEEDKVVVYLLKEFVVGASCYSLYINKKVKLSIENLKYLARGILIALDNLHRNNVVHKDLKESSIYINDTGAVQVTNYSIHRRLLDLNNQTNKNYNKKTDVYKFGIVILSLLQTSVISDENDVKIPNTLPADLYDFLSKCLNKNENDRYTTCKLLNHPFLNKSTVTFAPNYIEKQIEQERNLSPETTHTDLISQTSTNGQSRVKNEFEFYEHLGKGAYGDVIKFKNKLDGRYYAIKRIRLNPKNRSLNKKIVREVKLLSRLNHENVVRYFNSWIETTTIKDDTVSNASSVSTFDKIPKIIRNDEFTLNDNIEALVPSIKNVEVSVTYDSKSQAAYVNSSDDDSSDDDEEWGNGLYAGSDSDSIEFLHESGSESKSASTTPSSPKPLSIIENPNEFVQIDYMYIQMEFCEKSTLRTAIDNNLYLETDKVLRLFREIVEGLAYIHQQGMIHRDLKPVNIFLDSNDHVKIGDFGLATTNIKSKQNEYLFSKSTHDSEKEDTVDESKTGFVGTALYVAPEIIATIKVNYTQKVDIYSLGIILFEMCYRPLDTSMERNKILTKLRTKEIIFPEDFYTKEHEKHQYLIRWLLDHDILKRPNCQELLQSEHIPPPVLEECELRELVRHTLKNPQLKGYKYLIASCFNQDLTHIQDITYDKDPSAQNLAKPLNLQEFVRQICVKIFKKHGGQNLATPLLMPKCEYYQNLESHVKLMTHFGGIVSLPHDLRVPLARYIAWNGITSLRRYSIEKVYREKKVFGFQPRELYECAFDIVSPTPGMHMSDAEILYIVYEILTELPDLKNKHFTIRLNHKSLLKAILLHSGIKEEDKKHQEIYSKLCDVKEGKISKFEMQDYFIGLGLSDNTITFLLNILFNCEIEVSKIANYFQMITKKKSGDASRLALQAVKELKSISQNAEAYGVTYDMVVSPGLVYNVQQYSGLIFQFACELKKKHKHNAMEVLAAGGRYDSMISRYRSIMEQASIVSKSVQQSAVGVSISLDKLVQALQKEEGGELLKIGSLDVVVCSLSTKPMIQEKTQILRNLWSAGIRGALIESTNKEEIQEQITELKVSHVIMLKENEPGMVLVSYPDKERLQEKSFTTNELLENMQKILKHEGNQDNNMGTCIFRSDSKSSTNEKEADVDVLFVEKLSSTARKRYETQIRSQLSNLFKKLTGFVQVFALCLESNVVKTLASHLEFESEDLFHKSVKDVQERHPKYKKEINAICEGIYEQKTNKKIPTIVLYSTKDNIYKVIL